MSTKKKITQIELRKLMNEQKKRGTGDVKRIESPLAKYDLNGQLTCIVCESVVRSESVWTVHINSRGHRENIAKKAKRKDPPQEFKEPPAKKPLVTSTPPVRLKSILKNSDESPNINVPSNFFDSSKAIKLAGDYIDEEDDEPMNGSVDTADNSSDDKIPEGFFDDPKLDAKVRNVEYKDPIEEEWEQFQKAIKEETSKAQQIISEDQEEATTERQIDEIDEQLRHWSRVVVLEKKKEESVAIVSEVKTEIDEDILQDEEFEEFVDWRSKGSFL